MHEDCRSAYRNREKEMKTNKEVIRKLSDYFLTQNPGIVARVLANCMIDFHRIRNLDELPENEKDSLTFRIDANSQAVVDFVNNGPQGDLVPFNIESS